MSLLNWFKKDEQIDIPTAASIELTPIVQLDEENRSKLYDDAVREVQHARLRELILLELTVLASKEPERARQARELKDNHGFDYTSEFDGDYKDAILKVYPDLVINPVYECHASGNSYPTGRYRIVKPETSIEILANSLATQYLSE